MVLTLFVVQRAMPVGIVGGSDLSVITPDHFYATSPYVGAKRLGVEVRKRNDPKNKAVARRAAMCRPAHQVPALGAKYSPVELQGDRSSATESVKRESPLRRNPCP